MKVQLKKSITKDFNIALKKFNENYRKYQESIKESVEFSLSEIKKARSEYSLEFESLKSFLSAYGYIKPKDFEDFLWWLMEKNENEKGYIFPLPKIKPSDFREFSEFRKSEFFINTEEPLVNIKSDLFVKFYKYDFPKLEKVKGNADIIINHLVNKDLPYKIAYLKFLEFDVYLSEHFCKNKTELFKKIAEILDAPFRSVKGNFYVLNPKTKEDKNRYTSYIHSKEVVKHYKSLKMGV